MISIVKNLTWVVAGVIALVWRIMRLLIVAAVGLLRMEVAIGLIGAVAYLADSWEPRRQRSLRI